VSIFVTIVHVITCLLLIAVVLLQHGRGADVGAAFGSGASQTIFGARGAGNFLSRLTTGAAVVFMLTSLTLSYFSQPQGVIDLLERRAETAPAAQGASPETAPAGQEGGGAGEFEAVPLPREKAGPEGEGPDGG
jgi:preprotein translocase subunit SecG